MNRAVFWSWVRWLAVTLPIATLLVARWGRSVDPLIESWRESVCAVPPLIYVASAATLMAAAAATLAHVLFAGNPHLVDTIAQLFQARIFAGGSLTAPAPAHFEFFGASQLVRHAGNWFSQYPPGHSALLSIGLLVGAPWLVNPLFAAATVVLVFLTARRLLGDGTARLATALYLISPFALFMSASYMNHVTTGFFLTLALYAAVRAVGDRTAPALAPALALAPRRWAVVAGLAIGFAATIRPLEGAAWAAALGLWMLSRRAWMPVVITGAASALGLVPLLAYNNLTTGAPLRFGYTLLWGEGHGLGFHTNPWGEPFTPLISFANTALDLERLNISLLGLPLPSLFFVMVALVFAANDRRLRDASVVLAATFLAALVAYFFYWHRDSYLGPRFLYASLVPAILLAAAGVAALDRRLGRWRSVLRIALAASVLYAVSVNLPESAGVISGRDPELKLNPEDQLEREGFGEALVFVKVGWGSRLIGRLWGWGMPASETERTFLSVDGCRLQNALDEADSLAVAGLDSAQVQRMLAERLMKWRKLELPVTRGILPDHGVRVDTTMTLSGPCFAEAARDRSGYTLYGSLISRQDPWLRRGIVYARDLGEARNRELMASYMDRVPLLYMPLSPERGAVPVFVRLPPARAGE